MKPGIDSVERRPDDGIHRFAFVVHPLSIQNIHRHPAFGWTRWLPNDFVERISAALPPHRLGRITGGRSPVTGQRIEGLLYGLGATPRQLLSRPAEATYRQLVRIAHHAARSGAGLMGLGAFTKVVGDAGITVASRSPIPVTSGNSLTVAATLETAKQAAQRLDHRDLTRGRAMIVGATGAIGSVCSRLVAQAIRDVVLVSIEPERLVALKQTIEREVHGCRVETSLESASSIGDCHLIITATSAFGQRVIDVSKCRPGAIICDVALPSDISQEEAALRPDLLVIESGEVVIPGPVHFGYDVGLPPGVSYACLAEAALLAMAGRFEPFTLGRDIQLEKVKEIFRLFRHHRLELAPLRAFGRRLTEDDFAAKRALADALLADPGRLATVRGEAAARLARIPPRAKGVTAAAIGGRGWRRLGRARAAGRAALL